MAGLALVGLLAGCAAGPDFRPPDAPGAGAQGAALLLVPTGSAPTALGEAQRLTFDADLTAPWWQRLGSPALDALIAQALAASPTLTAARATRRQAEETQAAQAGATLYPRADASGGVQRQRTSPSAQGQAGEAREFNLFSASVGVHYQLDLAGANRRALEALAARADHRRYQLEGARLGLAAQIAATAVAQARLAGQIEASEAILNAQEEQQHLTRERVRLGQASPDELLAQQVQVEQTRAGLPPLRRQWQQSEHLLATLAGLEPGAPGLPTFTLQDFTLPQVLPQLVPSELVRQRPDIQAALALAHAAHAEYGAALARSYPQINLSANLGSQALSTGALLGGGATVWSLVGQLGQPLFNPALPAEQRAALAAFDAAAANYQGVVLDALRNVADVLRALDHDAQALAALAAADGAAQASLQSLQRQHALGAASYLQLLIAQQQAQQIRFNLVGAQAQRLADSAALYQAVGAGWTGAATQARVHSPGG